MSVLNPAVYVPLSHVSVLPEREMLSLLIFSASSGFFVSTSHLGRGGCVKSLIESRSLTA